MTKSRESGENEITDEAKREAIRAGLGVCEVLAKMLKAAKAAHDTNSVRKIVKAQKYLGCRNKRKREDA
jgi:hypothetical protein